MALFALGNLFCAFAPTYGLLMAARVLTAFSHAAFFGIGAVVAADLAPENQRGQAMSLMFAGLTLANVLGVPGGTALGQALGWRASFGCVALIGALAATGVALFVPRDAQPRRGDVLREFAVLADGRVLLGMAMSAASAAAFFAVFTYIAPILETVTGFSPRAVTGVLVTYGVGLTIGNVLGGRLGDWNPLRTIAGLFIAVIAVLASFTVTSHDRGAHARDDVRLGRRLLRARFAVADARHRYGARRAECGFDAQSGRLQHRLRLRRLARRRSAAVRRGL